MSQLGLFDGDRDPRLEAFEKHHAENPHVYEWVKARTFDLRHRGRSHYSMRTLLHAFRYHTAMTTTDPDFKINDHWSPFYARMLMDEHPELEGFFELRRAVADDG